MPHLDRLLYLRAKAAEYRRRAHGIEHPTLVADLLAVADDLETMAAQAEREVYRPPSAARRQTSHGHVGS